MARRSALLPLRVIPLLLAVTGLVGPGVAFAAGDPAPDPPASAGLPAPDAAPVAHPATVLVVRAPLVRSASAPLVVAPPQVVHARPAARRAPKRVVPAETPVVDIPPLQVDVPLGLGAEVRSLRDDSTALSAAVALLVAATVAASAVALTLVAARSTRTAI